MAIDEKWRTRLTLGGAGFAIGAVLWQVAEHWPEKGKTAAGLAALAMAAVTFGLVFALCSAGGRQARAIVLAASTSLPLAGLLYWTWWQYKTGIDSDQERLLVFFLTVPLALYALLPYLQTAQRRSGPGRLYADLFLHSWNNVFLLSLAGFFTGLFWALIRLWAQLFKLIGIELFDDIFSSKAFAWISTAAVFGLGVALSRENEKIIHTLRSLALSLCVFLLPLFAAIVVLFLGTLPFTGVGLLWDTGFGASLLLMLATLGILFLNGVFQDGREAPPYRGLLRLIVTLSVLGLPALGSLALYAVWLRYAQYGLTPDRFFAFLYAGTATLYGIGYAAAALIGRRTWMGGLRGMNIALSFVLIFLCLAPHTALLDPMRLSANQQLGRLARGDVAPKDFDFGLFQFDLGSIGRARLAALKALDTHPAHGEILKEIKQVVAAKHRWNWEEARRRRGQRPPEAEDFILYPPGIEVPEIVFRAAAKEMHPRVFDGCRKRKRCVLLALQLDSDPDLEYAVLPGPYREGILVEITPRGSWRSFPLQHRDYAWKGAADAVRDGDVGVLPSAYKRVRIGDKVWVVMEDLPSAGPQTPRGKPR